MRTAVVICPDDTRRDHLCRVVGETQPELKIETQGFRCTTAAVAECPRCDLVSLVVRSMKGEPPECTMIEDIRRAFANAKVIVDLADDDPEAGFRFLDQGAFVASPSTLTRVADLWALVSNAFAANRPPYPPLLTTCRPQPAWGFMSMAFSPISIANTDFSLAIQPAMARLGLGLDRLDDIERTRAAPPLRQSIREEILRRPVLVAHVSSHTTNTMWEIGLADAWDKDIILLRRRDGEALPAVLQGMTYVEYSTLTELAMKLLFGLGWTWVA